jgi:outer membrane protein TolC
LLAAKNEVELAKMQLNVVLNRPLREVFVAEEAGFEESGYVDLRDSVKGYVESPRSLQVYTEFLVEEALRNSPEVQELNASIAALERSYASLKRKPWIPTLGFRAENQHVFARDGVGSRVLGIETNDDVWSVSLVAQLPLFQGGSSRVSARQANIEITGLEEQRKQLHQAIEFDVRSAMLEVMVARVNLENAQRSAELSREGLELVQDEYAKGLAAIVDLVDAQNEALSDSLNALSSEYEFLISVFNTDRAVGSFDLLRTAKERQEFLSRFEDYLSERNR